MTLTKDDIESLKEIVVTKEQLEEKLSEAGIKDHSKAVSTVSEFLDHIKGCNKDDCEGHKFRSEIEDESLIEGVLLKMILDDDL